jgi:hypothetical protein
MFKKSGDRTHGHDDLGCRPLFTRPLDLGKLLDNIESDNVQSIDVASLAALMTDKNSHVVCLRPRDDFCCACGGRGAKARAGKSGHRVTALYR